jgi:hypothetical protein
MVLSNANITISDSMFLNNNAITGIGGAGIYLAFNNILNI